MGTPTSRSLSNTIRNLSAPTAGLVRIPLMGISVSTPSVGTLQGDDVWMAADATRFSGSLKGEFSRSRFPAFPFRSRFGWTRLLLSSRSPLLFSRPRTVVTFDFPMVFLYFPLLFPVFTSSCRLPRLVTISIAATSTFDH